MGYQRGGKVGDVAINDYVNQQLILPALREKLSLLEGLSDSKLLSIFFHCFQYGPGNLNDINVETIHNPDGAVVTISSASDLAHVAFEFANDMPFDTRLALSEFWTYYDIEWDDYELYRRGGPASINRGDNRTHIIWFEAKEHPYNSHPTMPAIIMYSSEYKRCVWYKIDIDEPARDGGPCEVAWEIDNPNMYTIVYNRDDGRVTETHNINSNIAQVTEVQVAYNSWSGIEEGYLMEMFS